MWITNLISQKKKQFMGTFQALFTCLTWVGLAAISSQKREDCLLIPEDYKSNSIPQSTKEDEVFAVKVDIEVWAITDIYLQKQHIEVDLRVTVEWVDYRLALVPNITSNRTWLALSKIDKNSIWKPTFFFRNCKGCSALSFRDNSNSELYVDRNTATLFGKHWMLNRYTCDIDLRAYPMDIQTCPIQLYTYEETYDAMRLNHSYPDQPGSVLSNLTLSEFIVPPIRKTYCTFTEKESETYDCLEIQIQLEHMVRFHLMTSYATTTFIVAVSWISFWLPVELAPARVALGLTSLLTLATRLDQVQKDLPPVAYVKAIDIWVFACIFLVSASLCEFAISHFRWRVEKAAREAAMNAEADPKSAKTANRQRKNVYVAKVQVRPYVVRKQVMVQAPSRKSSTKDGTIDRISRIAFPLFFLFFNIVYWSYYLTYYN